MFFKELKKTHYQPPSQACLMLLYRYSYLSNLSLNLLSKTPAYIYQVSLKQLAGHAKLISSMHCVAHYHY